MTYQQIADMLSDFHLPTTYRAFPIDNVPELPYIVYFFEKDNDFKADNVNFAPVRTLVIELYLDANGRTFETETQFETYLMANNLTFSKSEEFINAENKFRITYEMEVIAK